tara:strand:+ start:885 stop:1064 length:180 start_codon:yes stop_codon:yes gene_type:complete
MKEILNDREYEQIVLVIAKDKGFDVFTDIINEVERLSDTDGYFKLVDYCNPIQLKLTDK